MPKIKITKRHQKTNVQYPNCIPDNERNGNCNKNCQPSENCNQKHCCLTKFQQAEKCATATQNSQTQNCLKDTKEPLHTSADLHGKPFLNLLNIKNEPRDDYSNSVESQSTPTDSPKDQNNPSNSKQEKYLNIRAKLCDIDSDSKEANDFHEHSQLENELHIKNEFCDTNFDSDPPMCECPKEMKSCFKSVECSDKAGDCKNDHSNNSATVEVKSENHDSENNADSPPSEDRKRSRRNSKRKRDLEDHCPVCGLTIRCTELASHFSKEVENLSNIAKNVKKSRTVYKAREGFRCGINLAFLQAKCNRENRIAAKRAKYIKKHVILCPVCKVRISGTDEEINEHVLSCFGEEDDSDINVTDYDENYEEYEIGNETRIRAISLVPGGHRSLHGYSSKAKPADDEDDTDLNVDVDDTLSFGKPQYSELDVIHNTNSASDERELEQLRRAVILDPNAEPHVIECKKWSQNSEIQNEVDEITNSCLKNNTKDMKSKEDEVEDAKVKENIQKTESGIISSLKERIKDLEQQKNVKCLICLEPYTRPVVSTTCWHVHCEECWLVSMGVKKLCPQCNMIVFPTDLRRIYL